MALDEPFQDRVKQLAWELEQAIKFDRPAILLAVYRSEWVRAEAEAALVKRLRRAGQKVHHVFVNEQNHDLPTYLRQQADHQKTVYFISGIRFGGGKDGRNAYRALNIRREYFIDYRLRVVFWLTESEAFHLPRHAPDFWAFRHRVVEFLDAPEPEHITKYGEILAWREWGNRTFSEDTAAKIAYRERLLQELVDEPEATATRTELLYTLAPLYAAQGEYEKAIAALQEALPLARQLEDIRLQALCYNGLGNVYRNLGRFDEAIIAYYKAIEYTPEFATPHQGLGNVYTHLDRFDEAIAAYRKAVKLDPQLASAHSSLAACYRRLGREAEYNAQLETARRPLVEQKNEYNRACFAAICGDVEEALALLKIALEKGQVSIQWARQDPDFDFIHHDPRFQELVSSEKPA